MTHPVGVLDTSAVLRLGELEATDLPTEPLITTITLAELTVGPLVADDVRTRAERQLHLQEAEANYGDPLPFDSAAARAFGQIAADLRAGRQKPRARAFDALIAATAKAAALPLCTFNPDDFAGITGLEVVALQPTRAASPSQGPGS